LAVTPSNSRSITVSDAADSLLLVHAGWGHGLSVRRIICRLQGRSPLDGLGEAEGSPLRRRCLPGIHQPLPERLDRSVCLTQVILRQEICALSHNLRQPISLWCLHQTPRPSEFLHCNIQGSTAAEAMAVWRRADPEQVAHLFCICQISVDARDADLVTDSIPAACMLAG